MKAKLDNVDANPGDYKVSVTVYGSSKLRESENVDTGHQMCPDDIDSQCYTPVGPFKFPARQVPIGSKVEICIREPITDEEECNSDKNTSKGSPERIRVDVPDIPKAQDNDGTTDSDTRDNDGNDDQHDYVNCNIEDCTDDSYRCPDDIQSECFKIEND